MIDINILTIGEARELARELADLLPGAAGAAPVGVSALGVDWDFQSLPQGALIAVETVLGHYVGHLARVSNAQITLHAAAWVAATGRYSEWTEKGEAQEVEPIADGCAVIERSSVILTRRQPGQALRVVK